MKKLLMSLVLVGAIVVTGVPAFTNTAMAAEVIENEAITVSPRTSTFEVTGTNVNLRKTAGTSGKVVRVLKKGEYLSGGRKFIIKDGYEWTWVQCQKDGAEGWVAMNYLNEIG